MRKSRSRQVAMFILRSKPGSPDLSELRQSLVDAQKCHQDETKRNEVSPYEVHLPGGNCVSQVTTIDHSIYVAIGLTVFLH